MAMLWFASTGISITTTTAMNSGGNEEDMKILIARYGWAKKIMSFIFM